MDVDARLKNVDPAYRIAISEVRSRLSDEQIIDILERYVHGGLDRDEAMDALDIDFLGTLYEMIVIFGIQRPPLGQAEVERQAEMMRLILAGEDVPVALRQPAHWRKH